MSAFDNYDKDNLYSEMCDFLESHPISEFMEIVTYAIQTMEERHDND